MKKTVAFSILLAAVLLTGCASSVETAKIGPNGNPVHRIETSSVTDTFDTAAEICPHGYGLIGNPYENEDVYAITIECN